MTYEEFNALVAELGLKFDEPRKRHTVFVGSKSVVWFDDAEQAQAEVNRLEANGYANVRIRTSNW